VSFRSASWIRHAGATVAARVPPGRPRQAAIAAWLLALGAVGYMITRNVTNPVQFRMVDLDVYRNGALAVLNDRHLYSVLSRDGLLFTYPPAAAILAIPLVVVPLKAAVLAWLPMVYVPLAVVIWFAFRPLLARAGDYAPAVFAVLFGFCAFLMPMRQELHFGQIDIFLVVLCMLDCTVREPRWPRGALIGLATAIKLVPGVFIVYLLLTGRRRAAAVAAGTFTAVTLLAWAIAPADSNLYWTTMIFDSSRLGPNSQAANQSVRGILMRIYSPEAPPLALWLGLALLVAVAGFAAAVAVRRHGHELAGVAITGLLAALLSPVAWIHHICWIVIALGVIIGDGRDWRRVATAVVSGAFFTAVLPTWGKDLFLDQSVPNLVSRSVEDAFGVAALAVIVILFRLRASDPGPLAAVPAAPPGRSAAKRKVLAGSRDG
jgi:alpha-1,2-mannosyltransferase